MSNNYFELKTKEIKLRAQRDHARNQGLINEAMAKDKELQEIREERALLEVPKPTWEYTPVLEEEEYAS